jgi:anti-sigma regulatory factor (Ser/Thr protein kinase)
MGTLHATSDDSVVISRWPPSRRSVPRARRELVATLEAWAMSELRDTAELVLCELLTNAVRHAGGPSGRHIETRYCRLAADRVRLEVHDSGSALPALRRASDTDEEGRGLALVDVLTAHQWGVSSRNGVGKLVWAVASAPAASTDSPPWA